MNSLYRDQGSNKSLRMAYNVSTFPRNVDDAIFEREKERRGRGFNTACQQANLLSQRWNLWSIVGGRLFCGPTSAPYHGSVDRNGQIHAHTHTHTRICVWTRATCVGAPPCTGWPDLYSLTERRSLTRWKPTSSRFPSIPLAHALNAKVTEIVFAADKRTCNFPLLLERNVPGGKGIIPRFRMKSPSRSKRWWISKRINPCTNLISTLPWLFSRNSSDETRNSKSNFIIRSSNSIRRDYKNIFPRCTYNIEAPNRHTTQ